MNLSVFLFGEEQNNRSQKFDYYRSGAWTNKWT